MQKINEFIEGLLKEKGIVIDDEEVKKQVVADMTKELETEINRAAVEALDEEKTAELAEKIDNMDDAKVAEFLEASGVDLAKITDEVMQKFREFYLKGEAKNV